MLEPNTLLLEAKDPKRITCKGGTGEITLELTDTRLSDGDQVANGFNYVITPLLQEHLSQDHHHQDLLFILVYLQVTIK